jgi:tetratricopeptide (TPR) repeat protein
LAEVMMWLVLTLLACSSAPEPEPASEPQSMPVESRGPAAHSTGIAAFLAGDFKTAQQQLGEDPTRLLPRQRLMLGVAMLAQGSTTPGMRTVSAAVDSVKGVQGPDAELLRNIGAAIASRPPPRPWDDVLAAMPGDYIAWWLRGAMSLSASVDERLAWYDAAIAVDPEPLLAWVGKVTLLQRDDRRAEALAVFDAAGASCGNNPELWRLRAQHHLVDGDYVGVEAALRRVLALDATDWLSRGLLVRAAELDGRPEAVAELRAKLVDAPIEPRLTWLESQPAHALALGQPAPAAIALAADCVQAAIDGRQSRAAVRCGYEALRVYDHGGVPAEDALRVIGRVADSDLDEGDRADADVLRTWVRLRASAGGTEADRLALADRDLMQTGMWVRRRRGQQVAWAAAPEPAVAEANARSAEPPPQRCDDAWALAVALDVVGRDTAAAALERLARADGPCGHEGWGKARRVDAARRLAAR